MSIKYEVLVSRVYDFQKVEFKAISDTEMSAEEANNLRKETAKLADEALRELKLTLSIERERDSLFQKLTSLEEKYISKFPLVEEGEYAGKIDVASLTDEEKKKAYEYKRIRQLLLDTQIYNYSDNSGFSFTEV